MPIPLPPLAEQKRIVEEVEHRLSVVEEMETAVEANLKRAARLRQSILKKAFEGELVPQEGLARKGLARQARSGLSSESRRRVRWESLWGLIRRR